MWLLCGLVTLTVSKACCLVSKQYDIKMADAVLFPLIDFCLSLFLCIHTQHKTTAPVPTFPALVNRLQFTPHARKDNKNRGSSRFNISQKKEIQKLPPLKGMCLSLLV